MAASEHARPRPSRILIADDNPQGVELLEEYLADSGYELATSSDGEETIAKVRDWHPDIVLLDIMMPRISGFEVCKRIKADAATRGVGVIMVTALDQPSDVERGVDAGTDDFLTKPINKQDLLGRVRALLESLANPNDLERTIRYVETVEGGRE